MIGIVIGGTGTLGQHLVPILLKDKRYERIRILSRNEHRQSELEEQWRDTRLDWFIGDVRDPQRMWYAIRGCHEVFHLAAIKSVDKAEYNPMEAIATNIDGTRNVIRACIEHGVTKALFTSTDKAVAPVAIYGASKLAAEKLWIQSNSYSGANGTRFAAVRYGNVMASNGSVLKKWMTTAKTNGRPKITNASMTRFWIKPEDAAKFVADAMKIGNCAGQIRIPLMKSATMDRLYKAFCDVVGEENMPFVETGVRPGEKLHETLISEHEATLTTFVGDMFIRWPQDPPFEVHKYGSDLPEKFENGYTSHVAERFTMEELREMIRCSLS